jgi:hypothetical protein
MLQRLKNYGFALMVVAALVGAIYVAGSVKIPDPVPDYALQAEEIYRLEVGAASFVAFYLATMAVMLALDGRGFAEFGTRGLKAETVVGRGEERQQAAIRHQKLVERRTHIKLESLQSALDEAQGLLEIHQQRLDRLETES